MLNKQVISFKRRQICLYKEPWNSRIVVINRNSRLTFLCLHNKTWCLAMFKHRKWFTWLSMHWDFHHWRERWVCHQVNLEQVVPVQSFWHNLMEPSCHKPVPHKGKPPSCKECRAKNLLFFLCSEPSLTPCFCPHNLLLLPCFAFCSPPLVSHLQYSSKLVYFTFSSWHKNIFNSIIYKIYVENRLKEGERHFQIYLLV